MSFNNQPDWADKIVNNEFTETKETLDTKVSTIEFNVKHIEEMKGDLFKSLFQNKWR